MLLPVTSKLLPLALCYLLLSLHRLAVHCATVDLNWVSYNPLLVLSLFLVAVRSLSQFADYSFSLERVDEIIEYSQCDFLSKTILHLCWHRFSNCAAKKCLFYGLRCP